MQRMASAFSPERILMSLPWGVAPGWYGTHPRRLKSTLPFKVIAKRAKGLNSYQHGAKSHVIKLSGMEKAESLNHISVECRPWELHQKNQAIGVTQAP
jgi:hypothetical protein